MNSPLGWLKYAGAAILALGAAVLLRRSPVEKPKKELERGPDMRPADTNVAEIDMREEQLKEQHAKIEEVLIPKPTPNLPLGQAVDEWNKNA